MIVDRTTGSETGQPAKVIGAAEILRLQQIVRQVPVSRHVLTYATTLVRATRPQTKTASNTIRRYVHCGAGPRARPGAAGLFSGWNAPPGPVAAIMGF